ncbi:hypothetical protein FLACHUCJ7_01973 [Flavobacterium chungangense]|uniref:Uncharacterized protein n=1 Tax=Flavobacterium chungangense TaxID=554283 RepID=A0A6V6YZ08_9FLAO|nr:hypothetical protein FLACHUCJ7_01973 [Flavobacterium chungangense]
MQNLNFTKIKYFDINILETINKDVTVTKDTLSNIRLYYF